MKNDDATSSAGSLSIPWDSKSLQLMKFFLRHSLVQRTTTEEAGDMHMWSSLPASRSRKVVRPPPPFL